MVAITKVEGESEAVIRVAALLPPSDAQSPPHITWELSSQRTYHCPIDPLTLSMGVPTMLHPPQPSQVLAASEPLSLVYFRNDPASGALETVLSITASAPPRILRQQPLVDSTEAAMFQGGPWAYLIATHISRDINEALIHGYLLWNPTSAYLRAGRIMGQPPPFEENPKSVARAFKILSNVQGREALELVVARFGMLPLPLRSESWILELDLVSGVVLATPKPEYPTHFVAPLLYRFE